MASDVRLEGDSVLLDGNVGVGVAPSNVRLDVADRARLRGGSQTAGAWLFQASKDQAFVGMASDTCVGLWGNNGAGWGLIMDTATGNVGIGVPVGEAVRRLHVEGSEIHSGGSAGGLSFSDRGAKAFVASPKKGERWVWYANCGVARLWSGGDKLTISPQGQLTVGSIAAGPVAAKVLEVSDETKCSGRLSIHGSVVESVAIPKVGPDLKPTGESITKVELPTSIVLENDSIRVKVGATTIDLVAEIRQLRETVAALEAKVAKLP